MKRKIFIISILIIIAAQINVNLFNSDFKVSIAITLYSIFLIILGRYPVAPVTIIVAPGVFLSRALMVFIQTLSFSGTFRSYAPEIAFYITYGILLNIYLYTIDYSLADKKRLLPLILIDYIANLFEISLRINISVFSIKIQLMIIIVALLRTSLIWCFQAALEYQNLYLLKKEHATRYKNLLFLISKLKSEIIWMDKNSIAIENTMNISYKLYNKLKDAACSAAFSEEALSVAKDIHEIKKEYNIINRGITEALNDTYIDEGMWIKDIFLLLKEKLDSEAKIHNKEIIWNVNIISNFYTTKQYYLLSILRNILDNALEASYENINTVDINFVIEMKSQNYFISIGNNGKEIKKDYREFIFNPGFSTKIDYSTGVINRGLGLSLVKELVEDKLNGKINFSSDNHLTVFNIELPKSIGERT